MKDKIVDCLMFAIMTPLALLGVLVIGWLAIDVSQVVWQLITR